MKGTAATHFDFSLLNIIKFDHNVGPNICGYLSLVAFTLTNLSSLNHSFSI